MVGIGLIDWYQGVPRRTTPTGLVTSEILRNDFKGDWCGGGWVCVGGGEGGGGMEGKFD